MTAPVLDLSLLVLVPHSLGTVTSVRSTTVEPLTVDPTPGRRIRIVSLAGCFSSLHSALHHYTDPTSVQPCPWLSLAGNTSEHAPLESSQLFAWPFALSMVVSLSTTFSVALH